MSTIESQRDRKHGLVGFIFYSSIAKVSAPCRNGGTTLIDTALMVINLKVIYREVKRVVEHNDSGNPHY